MIEVQDILARHGGEFLETHPISPVQAKAFRAIQNCRTSALGAHVDVCDECGFEKISYNSCRNRHCPKCQSFTKEQWVEKQNQYLLNSNYFHVVFTLPEQLNSVMLRNQEIAYGLYFKAMSETLLELCADPKYLGAKPGITAVLHTWGQNLMYHPHIHCVVTGGGLDQNQRWHTSRKKFFLPVKVLSRKFRGKFLFYLKQAGLSFDSVLYQNEWVVYCKPPFQNASKVIEYLGRYTHRVAISNHRILKLENGMVTFSWRDYRDNNKTKAMTVTAAEFIRRFLLHILPSGFRKIRHYGILASRDKSIRISLCKKLTRTRFATKANPIQTIEKLRKMLGDDFDLCPHCGVGHLSRASPDKASA
jgi:hypothetical protein